MKCFWNSLFCVYLLPNTWLRVEQELSSLFRIWVYPQGCSHSQPPPVPCFCLFPAHTITAGSCIPPVGVKKWDSIWQMELGEELGGACFVYIYYTQNLLYTKFIIHSVPAPPCRAKPSCPLESSAGGESGAPGSPRVAPGSCEQPTKQLQCLWSCKILLFFQRMKCGSQSCFLCLHPGVSSSPLEQDESVCVVGQQFSQQFSESSREQQWQNRAWVWKLLFETCPWRGWSWHFCSSALGKSHPPISSSLSTSPFSLLTAA